MGLIYTPFCLFDVLLLFSLYFLIILLKSDSNISVISESGFFFSLLLVEIDYSWVSVTFPCLCACPVSFECSKHDGWHVTEYGLLLTVGECDFLFSQLLLILSWLVLSFLMRRLESLKHGLLEVGLIRLSLVMYLFSSFHTSWTLYSCSQLEQAPGGAGDVVYPGTLSLVVWSYNMDCS